MSSQAASNPTLSSGDILVVDDSQANRLAIEAALEGIGGYVVCAQSGDEALKLLLQHDFALILLDVKMPSMGGLETARLIRERRRSRYTPIIFVTAYSREDHDVAAGYRLGAVDFLFKPIVPEVLRAKASVFVELQRRTAEVAQQADLLRAHALREQALTLEEERRRWTAEAMQRRMEELADADRRKDEFLAMLGHELRNPLAPIMTGIALLQKKLAADARTEGQTLRVCERIERQARHLTRLVDDLLDISRITSGKIDLQRTRMVLQDIVGQAISTSRPLIDEARHELVVDMPDEEILLQADGVRLAQVVSNLLNNAARYTPAGGRLQLRCVPHDGVVDIHVMDNGKGISADFLPQVFEMFAQAHEVNTGGLGLGLSLVKTLVTLHHGEVVAHSEGLGRGSRFTVTLPTIREPATAAALAETEEPAAADSGPAAATPLHIVIVEDNADVRDSLEELLEEFGHHVEVAPEGEAGVDLILRTEPDFAFIDLGMPVLDGFGVARRVRASPMKKNVRLVAMTGFGQEPDRLRAKDAGFDAHLVKPASLEAIFAVLSHQE